jgi:RHS repeat-associated protein
VDSYTQTYIVANAQDYYPFGERIRYVTGDPYNDSYKFTEKERDDESGYDYFGARYYDSELGRWLSVDPLADKYPESLLEVQFFAYSFTKQIVI